MQNVGSVVVGALIALLGTVVVQLWLIPRVESRKRREQRWESDVRSLGELLIFSGYNVASQAVNELRWRIMLVEAYGGNDPDRLNELKRKQEDGWRAAWTDYERLKLQVRWLVDRVMAVAPQSRSLLAFEARAGKLSQEQLLLSLLQHSVELGHPTNEDVDKANDAVRRATTDLVDELKRLADGPPPHDPPWPARRLRALHVRNRGASAS